MGNQHVNALNKPIYPCLWFDGNAKEAAKFYCSVFSDSAIVDENPMVVTFIAAGQKFMCLNGGPQFKFTPAISFYTIVQNEVDIQEVWDKLIVNGRALIPLDTYPWSQKYGWLQDEFGVTWQLTIDKPEFSDQKFIPALLFSGTNFGKAEEAINFYTSIFEDSNIKMISRYGANDANGQDGSINHAQFELNGKLFAAMDSALVHDFDFNEALSFVIECRDQDQIDYFWEKLVEGGKESQCGWLKDKFGVSWQIVPEILSELMSDPERSGRVVQAFMKMNKFDIEELKNA
ncbi:VOC family protein [Algoriphagus aquimarinus]|uniref:Glyoxalase superfamily enzyme, possibly 3-demethylubiquinone-9 3-methyltransferase n=1 Tax=Algoriphagus aquimarinus TaxID=237018 RepID=A0A1I1BD12_9BACT|nr:VOC family protein [Algoriphagus aquimarinus]SFB47997.1 Glyoxalase superfamily enzyme, possibly 3-demethylubiquinone-9 3-methyltransferase [Algoriphagus aquimarinus]